MAKILIVDDDTQTTTLLESMVKMKGHEPTSVNLSRYTIKTASAIHPNIILLDIMMEEFNGIELCKLLKADPNLKNIPVIMVSALDDLASKKDSFNAGAVDFITKPVTPDDLVQRIQDALRI